MFTPQKDRSDTTLSISATNSARAGARQSLGLDTPVQFLKGVGPKLGEVFASRGIRTIGELLFFFPRTYEDRSKILKIAEIPVDTTTPVTVEVEVISARTAYMGRGHKTMFTVQCRDSSGFLTLKWFYAPKGMVDRFKAGARFFATGTPKRYLSSVEILHPETTWSSSEQNVGRIVPIYPELDGIPTRTFRKILSVAVEQAASWVHDDVPERYLQSHRLPSISKAIRTIHFPDSLQKSDTDFFSTPAHQRLIYDEFFKFEYFILKRRLKMRREEAIALDSRAAGIAVSDLTAALPFSLTGDQQASLKDILGDLEQPHPMNRLIQGDVGSGKTAVAMLAAGAVLAQGGQAALMAPTEILAEQHYLSVDKLFRGKIQSVMITGKTPAAERRVILERLEKGEPLLVVGTHALIEDPVQFKNLILVMIDEQHRFGVEQRRLLRQKGRLSPHTLVLTATPIPRTLALTAYGDLSVSTIRELPPGRSPVKTQICAEANKLAAYQKIRSELSAGRQAYWVCPLVNESESEGFIHLKNATFEAERLQHEVFPDFKVGLLHGQQKSDEKQAIMQSFKEGKIHVLVSTTVIEVGVDVPNATVMAIEHSERFGLSQLHQLRGRVGRGKHQSYCYLFTAQRTGELSKQRLDVLESTQDGFKIAEADLEIRGPGEFLGTRQAGSMPFKMASLIRDQEWLTRARNDVIDLLKTDPDSFLAENDPWRRFLDRHGKIQSERLST